ncbi:hypothetical protein HA402_015593 [Bradysia odoriphaga]|nr:hypothetical protein HA402_015593 [Bradysia odoriphaga]
MGDQIRGIKLRKEKVAPEGGWGFVCAFGFTLPLACGLGSLQSFGLMFNEFLAQLGATTREVTLINGVFFSALSFSALGASLLFKRFSLRCVGLLGATIYSAGSFMTIFVTSVQMLLVSYGFLQGLGTGIIAAVGYTNFNLYFIKKRLFVMSAAQALKGLLIMFYPILVNFTMNQYGFRGAMAIIAAVNTHAFFGMLAQHPVEWHYKVIEVAEHELKPLMENEANGTEIAVPTQPSAEQELENTAANQIRIESTKTWNMDDCATLVSIAAGADMVSRCALAGLTFFLQPKARYIFLGGSIGLLIVRFGFFRTWLHVPWSLTLAEYLPPERFASGYGLLMFILGNWTFVFGPVAGWIRDVTQSYVAFICSVQLFLLLCVVIWIIEMIWMRTSSKKEHKSFYKLVTLNIEVDYDRTN